MMDARLERIKELFSESEKRNGELAHENFKLKKRIAELEEETGIVRCRDCKHYGTEDDYDMCKLTRILHDDDWFCAYGERNEMPTTDIVYCKDCKYSEVDKMGWYCNKYYHRVTESEACEII